MTINPQTFLLLIDSMNTAIQMWEKFKENPNISPEELIAIRNANRSKEDEALFNIAKYTGD